MQSVCVPFSCILHGSLAMHLHMPHFQISQKKMTLRPFTAGATALLALTARLGSTAMLSSLLAAQHWRDKDASGRLHQQRAHNIQWDLPRAQLE